MNYQLFTAVLLMPLPALQAAEPPGKPVVFWSAEPVLPGESAISAPQPWWFQADDGRCATPGGWVRVCGRCLALDPAKAAVQLRAKSTASNRSKISCSIHLSCTRRDVS